MAKSYYSLGRNLSRAEAIAGWCYLPFYLVLLSAGIQYLAALLGLTLSALRQSSCPEDAPKPPRPAKRLSERLVEAGKILFYSTHVCL